MTSPEFDGTPSADTTNTPASAPTPQSPPRNNVPGIFGESSTPKSESATHSSTFPTMSYTPQSDLQLDREHELAASPTTEMLQSVVPLSVQGGGVLAAALCHAKPGSNRVPDTRHA